MAPLAPAQAQTEEPEYDLPPTCARIDSSAFIHLVHCPGPMSQDAFADAGRAVCEGKLPCGVWFWKRSEDIPEKAPGNHDGLTQAQVTSASGVWSGQDQIFIEIAKTN
jgi:hypothetical protein